MKTTVVTVCSRFPRDNEPYYRPNALMDSLAKFGTKPVVLGLNESWGGLMTKPLRFRDWLRQADQSGRAILCDAFDVIFQEHPDAISQMCHDIFGEAVVFNAEKSCWPLTELAPRFPDEGTPWRYLNGGVMCGPVSLLLKMFEAMNLEQYGIDREEDGRRIEPNDAVPLAKVFIEQPVPVKVDAKCAVFQCFSECTVDEFDHSEDGTLVHNRVTGTTPGILHFNGGAKNELMPMVMRAMKL